MWRNIAFAMVISLLCCNAARAEELQETGLRGWLRTMQKKIDILNPRKTLPVTTGVAGVRGAKQEDKTMLYWKGDTAEPQVSEAELKEFREALAFVEAGDLANAAHEIEEFMLQYPDSDLIPDAKKMLDMVKAERTAVPKTEKIEGVSAVQNEVRTGEKPEANEKIPEGQIQSGSVEQALPQIERK